MVLLCIVPKMLEGAPVPTRFVGTLKAQTKIPRKFVGTGVPTRFVGTLLQHSTNIPRKHVGTVVP